MRKGLLQIFIIAVYKCYLRMIFICFKGFFYGFSLMMPEHFLYKYNIICMYVELTIQCGYLRNCLRLLTLLEQVQMHEKRYKT